MAPAVPTSPCHRGVQQQCDWTALESSLPECAVEPVRRIMAVGCGGGCPVGVCSGLIDCGTPLRVGRPRREGCCLLSAQTWIPIE